MIHAPDVRATVDWYSSIGFNLIRQNEDDGEINWAKLSFENSEVMFDAVGKPSSEDRREVDLYLLTDNADDLYHRFKDRVQVVLELYDASTATVSSSSAIAAVSGSPSANPFKRNRSPGPDDRTRWLQVNS
jgi:hypothetical protein